MEGGEKRERENVLRSSALTGVLLQTAYARVLAKVVAGVLPVRCRCDDATVTERVNLALRRMTMLMRQN